jgi:hypothetical protein
MRTSPHSTAAQSSVLFLLFILLLSSACQSQTPQTGHRMIAAAVRSLLDKAYAGVDYQTYRAALYEVETASNAYLSATPHHLQDKVNEILAYLRTAEEILRWQTERTNEEKRPIADPAVTNWTERYSFLRAAVGAQGQSGFDAPTALTLLWDKADGVLRGLQVKNKPI